jgi:predicted aldo/keto reductase-like oxidoreductase
LTNSTAISTFMQCSPRAFGKPTPRLGLAARGDTNLARDDVLHAVARGLRFLNWYGMADSGELVPDGMSAAIASLGAERDDIVLSAQFGARTAADARHELDTLLAALNTDYIDVLTLYYVEREDEWDAIRRPGGLLEFCHAAKRTGLIRRLGVTTHQRPLAARMAQSGQIDLLMIRYNAAHRGAETTIFPVTSERAMPVIGFTATRWTALMQATPDDPPAFEVPRAPAWYRFALQQPTLSIVLCAPTTRAELDEDLTVLDATGPLSTAEYAQLLDHGDRVRKHAGHFI